MNYSRYLLTVSTILLIGWTTLHAQVENPAAWQEDLQFLRHVITTENAHFFDTYDRIEWENQANELQKAIPAMESHEIIVGLAKLVAAFRVGHTQIPIHPWRGHMMSGVGFQRYALRLYVFSDGVYVRAAKERYRKAVGGKVLKLGGMPIAEAMEAVRQVIPWENEQFFLSMVPAFLTCPEILHAQKVISQVGPTTLTFEKNGTTQTIELHPEPGGHIPGHRGYASPGSDWVEANHGSAKPLPLYLKDLDPNYSYEYLPKHKLLYVRHSSVRDEDDESIEHFFGRVEDFIDNNDVQKMVLDLRLNGGGNNYLNKPVITGLIRSKKINQPGRLFTILGRRTFSAAQNMVNEIEKYTETIFVGEPTAENVNFWGDTRQYDLPNSKLPVFLSWMWWQNLDPRDRRPWTAPDIAIDLTFDDYKNNHDPVLQAILDYDHQQPLLAELRTLAQSGKIDLAMTRARQHANDPRNRYRGVEGDLNRFGYELLNQNQTARAISVFRLNTELYPQSANTFDSLAEGLWRSGDIDAAITQYEKALGMDPDGVGVNSAEMLRRIKTQLAGQEADASH